MRAVVLSGSPAHRPEPGVQPLPSPYGSVTSGNASTW
jgi:hypothetical protein